MSTLYTLVVTTIMATSTQGGLMYDQLVEKTPNLSYSQCQTQKTAVYNDAVAKKRNIVVKCTPQ